MIHEIKKWALRAALMLSVIILGIAVCLADINDDLFQAIFHRDVGKVKSLLSAGADANARTRILSGTYISALYAAVTYANIDMVKMLLQKGADVNFREEQSGNTPLLLASLQGRAEIARMLLAKGAEVNARDRLLNETPLMTAAFANRFAIFYSIGY